MRTDRTPKAATKGIARRHVDWRRWGRWELSFLGYPLAGLAARAAAGGIDDVPSALVGGLAAGATLGLVQAIALGGRRSSQLRWVLATAAGLAVGLAAGSAAVGYRTDPTSLVVMGLLTGVGVGLAQAIALPADLPAGLGRRVVWAMATPALWALGWAITAQVIVDADSRFATFGASGALVMTTLGGAILSFRHAEPGASGLRGSARRASKGDAAGGPNAAAVVAFATAAV